MKHQKDLFYRKLFALVLPMALQNLMTALVGASDALMLGLLDQSSLSAVSLATQVQFVLSLFYSALTIGATVLAAQYWGKGDGEAVEKVLAIVLKVSFIISAVFFLSSLCVPGLLMRIFTSDAELILLGIPYLRLVSWSYLFMGISQIYLCIMKNSGRALLSTIYGSSSVILNIVLNAVLIFGLAGLPEMGIRGAALATVISRAAELLLVIAEHVKKDIVRIRWKYVRRPDRILRKDFYHYTMPVLANEIIWGCGITMFSVIMGHMGNDAVAANSIAGVTKNLISCFCLGIGAGSGIVVGNELGRGNLERAKEYGGRLCRISVVSGVISGAFLLACSPLILRFASNLSVQAQGYLKIMLYICSYYMVGKSISATLIAGIFCAGGDTRFGLICDAVNMWVVIIPMGLLAAFVFQLPVPVVFFLLNLDEILKLPVEYLHYKKYRWVKNLTISNNI